MSADPTPFSGVSLPRLDIEVGETYRTTSGRDLTVTKLKDGSVHYTDEKGEPFRANRRIFEAAVRGIS